MNDEINDKRELTRLLCSDSFGLSTVVSNQVEQVLTSINFHRRGMALYTTNPLPDFEQCAISFEYKTKKVHYKICHLPINIRHRYETDAGSQYGVKFLLSSETPDEVLRTLNNIEQALIESNQDDNRYGF